MMEDHRLPASVALSAAAELTKVHRALFLGRAMLDGIDQATAALALRERAAYSPLRTLFEQGLLTIEQVQATLRDGAATICTATGAASTADPDQES